MEYETIEILKEETYRSKPMLNITDNMMRVTLTCSRNEWHEIKRHLTSAIHSDARKQCPSCVDADLVDVPTCPKCGYFERQ